MKSKVLSLVLALTVLCSIMSVSTVSYAAASKGDEIAPATLKASISYGGTNSSNLAGVTRTTFADRGEVAGLLTTDGLKPGVSATNDIAGFKVVPAGLDLTKAFTFEFEYYAKAGVWADLAFGGKDVFIANPDGKAFINTRNAFNTTDSTAATAAPETWHKVLVNYDGANYRVYLNDVLLKNPDGASAFVPASTISNLIIGFYGEIALPSTGDDMDRLYVDNVYAYEGAYKPDGTKEPEVEKDAAASKGDEIAPATLKASISYGGTNSSNLAGVLRTTFADRGEVAGLITTNGLKPGGSATNGIAGFKVIPAGLDLTKPFTFEYEYYAKAGVWAELSFGGKDVFIANPDGKAFINTKNAFNTTDSTAATAAPETWHKVLINYDGANYRVYLNGVLLKNQEGASAFVPASTISNLIIGFYGEIALPSTGDDMDRLYVDNVYAYEGAYKPDGTKEPEVEKDAITIKGNASAATVTASAIFSDTYATGEYRFYLATYDAQEGRFLGVTWVDIDAAGYKELKITFDTTDAFSDVDYAKAFVWAKDNFAPTGVKTLLGSEPNN